MSSEIGVVGLPVSGEIDAIGLPVSSEVDVVEVAISNETIAVKLLFSCKIGLSCIWHDFSDSQKSRLPITL